MSKKSQIDLGNIETLTTYEIEIRDGDVHALKILLEATKALAIAIYADHHEEVYDRLLYNVNNMKRLKDRPIITER